MASTLWRSCSVIRTFSRLPNSAEIRCLYRTAAVWKPVLKSTSLPCKIHANSTSAFVCRGIHITRKVLMKDKKDELYEEFRVYNQEGQYLCTTEMYVVDRFCHRYRVFTFEQMEKAPTSDGDNSLKAVKLIHKPKHSTENAEKKIKTIKFKKDLRADDKLPKILGILVNSGKVKVHFEHEKSKVEPVVRETLLKFSVISKAMPLNPGSAILVTMKPFDNIILISLLEAMRAEHAELIASVKDMLECIKKET